MSIFNIHGALLGHYLINASHTSIDVQELAEGVYFVQVKTKENTECLKMIKSK